MSKMTRQDFYTMAESWVEKDREAWNHITLVAYFIVKYKSKTGVSYRFPRWSGNPALTKESRDFAKLVKLYLPDDYDFLNKAKQKSSKSYSINKIYNFINWMFDYKFRYGNKTVTGTGIFLNHNMLNEFEIMYSAYEKKNENKSSIDALLKWISAEIPEILDSHQLERVEDLGMIQEYIKMYELDESTPEQRLIRKAREIRII